MSSISWFSIFRFFSFLPSCARKQLVSASGFGSHLFTRLADHNQIKAVLSLDRICTNCSLVPLFPTTKHRSKTGHTFRAAELKAGFEILMDDSCLGFEIELASVLRAWLIWAANVVARGYSFIKIEGLMQDSHYYNNRNKNTINSTSSEVCA